MAIVAQEAITTGLGNKLADLQLLDKAPNMENLLQAASNALKSGIVSPAAIAKNHKGIPLGVDDAPDMRFVNVKRPAAY